MTKPATKELGRVSDVVDSGFEDFYPDATKTTINNVISMGDVVILDVGIIENFETEYGKHPLAIIAVTQSLDAAETFTFPSSGQVIVDKMRQLKAKKAMPLIGHFTKDDQYYDVK